MTRGREYNNHILVETRDYLARLLQKIQFNLHHLDHRCGIGNRILGYLEGSGYTAMSPITSLYVTNRLQEFVDYAGQTWEELK